MPTTRIERQLLRARDYVERHYATAIDVDDMARAAGYSRAHFTREFRRAFGETPRAYLLTRRLERAASLLRTTDWPVSEVCWSVGLTSVGSFTTSFSRTYGMSPSVWRETGPPAATLARIPGCVRRIYGRRSRSTSGEVPPPGRP